MREYAAEVDLPATERSARQARLLVAALLRAWGHDDDVDIAELLASELAANAARHTTGTMRVSVAAGPDCVRLGVSDEYSTLPVLRRPTRDGEAGRGLQIVATLSSRWGVERGPEGRPDGKRIWCEL